MERRQVQLYVEDIFISEAKAGFIAQRHISIGEVFEVLGNDPHFFVRTDAETGAAEYAMLGKTDSGRFLTVALEEMSEGLWRLITAYPLRESRGRRLYDGS